MLKNAVFRIFLLIFCFSLFKYTYYYNYRSHISLQVAKLANSAGVQILIFPSVFVRVRVSVSVCVRVRVSLCVLYVCVCVGTLPCHTTQCQFPAHGVHYPQSHMLEYTQPDSPAVKHMYVCVYVCMPREVCVLICAVCVRMPVCLSVCWCV